MYTKKHKILAFLTCVTFVLVTLFSILVIVKEADHDCTGENCPICVCIHQVEQTLKNLGTGTIKAVGWVFVQALLVLAVSCIFLFIPYISLVSQKVRLNN